MTRLREALADYFVFDNRYGSTDVDWRKCFHSFTYAVAHIGYAIDNLFCAHTVNASSVLTFQQFPAMGTGGSS